jgi:transposase
VRAAMPRARNGRSEALPLWNAIFCQAGNDGTWSTLPHDLPAWPAEWQQYRRWREGGTQEAVQEVLRSTVQKKEGLFGAARAPEKSS